MAQVERIYLIDIWLQDGRPFTCEDVAKAFEITRRSAQREIEYMRDRLRCPIEYDRKAGTYRYSEQYKLFANKSKRW